MYNVFFLLLFLVWVFFWLGSTVQFQSGCSCALLFVFVFSFGSSFPRTRGYTYVLFRHGTRRNAHEFELILRNGPIVGIVGVATLRNFGIISRGGQEPGLEGVGKVQFHQGD